MEIEKQFIALIKDIYKSSYSAQQSAQCDSLAKPSLLYFPSPHPISFPQFKLYVRLEWRKKKWGAKLSFPPISKK